MMRLLALILLLSCFTPHLAQACGKPYVVLLHGIARSSGSMKPMQDWMEQHGYEVINIDYPSTKHNLNDLTKMVHKHIVNRTRRNSRPIYMVGHSMGGIIIRLMDQNYKIRNFKSAVLLGTPNQGSQLAEILKDLRLYKWIYGKAGQELAIEQEGVIAKLGEPNHPIAVIAGNKSIDPISSTLLKGVDDGKVLLQNTHFNGEAAHITMPVTHAFMMQNEKVMCQANAFFRTGNFNEAACK